MIDTVKKPIELPDLVEEWLRWAAWVSSRENKGRDNNELIGWSEFDWAVTEKPEHAWQSILAVIADPRAEPYLGILAAGPIEDLLSLHGEIFIVETEARSNPIFAKTLGGVWQHTMSANVWARVQAVWHREAK